MISCWACKRIYKRLGWFTRHANGHPKIAWTLQTRIVKGAMRKFAESVDIMMNKPDTMFAKITHMREATDYWRGYHAEEI